MKENINNECYVNVEQRDEHNTETEMITGH